MIDALIKELNEGKSMEIILEGMLYMTVDLNKKSGTENQIVISPEDMFLTSGIFQGVVKDMREVRRSRMKADNKGDKVCTNHNARLYRDGDEGVHATAQDSLQQDCISQMQA